MSGDLGGADELRGFPGDGHLCTVIQDEDEGVIRGEHVRA
jgi:hypothetical protein